MYVLNPDGTIIDANPQCCRALKVSKEQLIGTPILNWTAREDRDLAQRGYERLRNKQPQLRTTRRLQASDRTMLTVEALEIPHSHEGELVQISGVARDISEEVTLERKLWDSGDQHEQTLDFALRTSLGLMKGYVYALGQAPDADIHRRRRYVAVIEEEIEHLGKLIEDVLDMQKLDPAQLDMRGEYVDPVECVRSAVSQLESEAARREIEVLCQVPESCKPLYGTVEIIRRIAVNLIQNAIQHTLHDGCVQVELADRDDWVELRVRDHGAGIPEQALPHIFDRFYRGPQSAHDTPGVGLGLAVTQMFVTALGGKIWVRSGPDTGTEFTVVLPRRYAELDELEMTGAAEESPAREPQQVATA
jgi:PAS domain S-box-containing protein